MTEIQVGRLLRADMRGCVAGCPAGQDFPHFGGLVAIPLEAGLKIFGLVSDIHIDDDGLVRQLVVASDMPPEIIEDNRLNRNIPIEISVIFVGHAQSGTISHRLPPRPPLSLDSMLACSAEEMRAFTSAGCFGYFRHVLNLPDAPYADLLAAHLRQAGESQAAAGNSDWLTNAIREVITLLRDDHAMLTAVLSAIADVLPNQ